jgi:acetyl-CoA carboxylase carboxyltransferase component
MVKQLLRVMRIDGWAVGIVANQRSKTEMQFGGVIYSDSADKATLYCQLQSENPFFLFRMLPVLWWDLNQNKAEL